MSAYGIQPRESRPATWVTCRQRGGAVVRGEVVMLDLAGADSDATLPPGAVGTQSSQGSPWSTVVQATTGLDSGRVGVAVDSVSDDSLGYYEFGLHGGVSEDVIVEARVIVGAAAVKGAALKVQQLTGIANFSADGTGTVYATLLEDATSDDGGGPSATINYKRVQLHTTGRAGSVTGAVDADDALADASLTRDKIMDEEIFLASRPRRAAFSGKGPKGLAAFASLSWAPSATPNFAVQFRIASSAAPAANMRIAGSASLTTHASIQLGSDGSLALVAGPTLLSSAAGVVVFDGSAHEVRFDITQTGATITVNGAAVASGSFSNTWLTTPYTWYIGGSSNSVGLRFPGALWDVELIDNVTPANSVTLRMDEVSGNYRNSYSGTTAAAYATRNGVVGSVLVNTAEGNGALVPAMPEERKRVAAFSGLGSTGQGAFASMSWAPKTGTSFRLGVTLASFVAPSTDCGIVWRAANGYASIHMSTAGVVHVRNNAATLLSSGTGAVQFGGGVYRIEVDITDTTVALYINGASVASATVSSQSWSTSANTYVIGSATAASSQRWPGSIHNVEFIDYSDANNNMRFDMDEVSGDYANAYRRSTDPLYNASNTAATTATRNGYVSTCAVTSTDGRGMPWQLGCGAPLIYTGRHTTGGTLDGSTGASKVIQMNAEYLDPTGHFAINTDNVWVAPCAGIADVSWGISFLTNADPADQCLPVIDFNGTYRYLGDVELGARAEQDSVSFSFAEAMPVGGYLRLRVEGLLATTTIDYGYSWVVIRFYPTPVAG